MGDEQERLLNVPEFHPVSQPVAILEVGRSLGNFYGWETDGFFDSEEEINASADQQPASRAKPIVGAPKFVDQNNDGVVDTEDRVVIGNALPDFIGGFSIRMAYKSFDLGIQGSFSIGNDILNANRQWLEFGNGRHNGTRDMLNRWSPGKTPEQNANAETAIATNPTTINGFVMYDRWVEDGSFVRMNNIQLGYNIPTEKWIAGLRYARVYVSAQNLITITGYSGFDPEVNRFGQNNILRGFDVNSYPIAKTFLVGVNLGL